MTNEYAHAMGNSLGNIIDYWNTIYQYDMLAGGFVWDWVDQALWRNPDDAGSGYVYGGDYGDVPNNTNFCVNGLVGADRLPHPHYYELRKVYQPVTFTHSEENPMMLSVTNRSLSTDLANYDWSYVLTDDGKTIGSGSLPPLQAAPGKTVSFEMPRAWTDSAVGKDRQLTLRLSLKSNTPWAERGFVVAWEQFALSECLPQRPVLAADRRNGMKLVRTAADYRITGQHFSVTLSRTTGLLTFYI